MLGGHRLTCQGQQLGLQDAGFLAGVNTAPIYLDLHRQPGIIRGLIPVGDLHRVPLQPHDRAVRAPQLQTGGVEPHHKRPATGGIGDAGDHQFLVGQGIGRAYRQHAHVVPALFSRSAASSSASSGVATTLPASVSSTASCMFGARRVRSQPAASIRRQVARRFGPYTGTSPPCVSSRSISLVATGPGRFASRAASTISTCSGDGR